MSDVWLIYGFTLIRFGFDDIEERLFNAGATDYSGYLTLNPPCASCVVGDTQMDQHELTSKF